MGTCSTQIPLLGHSRYLETCGNSRHVVSGLFFSFGLGQCKRIKIVVYTFPHVHVDLKGLRAYHAYTYIYIYVYMYVTVYIYIHVYERMHI